MSYNESPVTKQTTHTHTHTHSTAHILQYTGWGLYLSLYLTFGRSFFPAKIR